MTGIFIAALNMSLSAGWIVLVVVALRFLLKKAPKWVHCLLWGVVALRLMLPVFPESGFSLIPSAEVIPQDIGTAQAPVIHSGFSTVNNAVNPALPGLLGTSLQTVLQIGAMLWLFGVGVMLLYSAVSYLRLGKCVAVSLPLGDRAYLCDDIDTPFILGIFRPRIYIPSRLTPGQQAYVLAHEKAHLARKDHWWKPVGYILLTLYWFHPLLWLAYILLCRDIERACDEKVVRDMDNQDKKAYSETLVACSLQRRMVAACPLAFGEVAVKDRIKGILNYKKPVFWVMAAAILACVVTAVCFLSNPKPCEHVYKSTVTQSSTCTQEGEETFTCQDCWESYTQPIPVLSHTLGPAMLLKEPNCTEKGQRAATCTVCYETCVVEILATNDSHNMEVTTDRAATCTEAGEKLSACTRCGHTESQTYEALGHDYGLIIKLSATCFVEGYEEYACKNCGGKRYLSQPKTEDHTWGRGFVPGTQMCLGCGETRGSSSVSYQTNTGTSQSTVTTPKTYTPQNMFPVIRIWP